MRANPEKPDTTKHDTTPEVSHVSDETLRGFIGYNMKRAFNFIQADLAQVLKPHDLRMVTFSTLVLIVDNPGMRQSQLADALAIERPNLVVILDELERRDLISRDRVPTDRRAHALKATFKGRRLFEKALRDVKDHEDRVMAKMGLDDRARVIAAMRLIEAE